MRPTIAMANYFKTFNDEHKISLVKTRIDNQSMQLVIKIVNAYCKYVLYVHKDRFAAIKASTK